MTSGIWAKSILTSKHSITAKQIDTLLVRMPRCILAEFNTHWVFSHNAASSRAIPISKMIEQVEKDPFIPMKWTKNEPGMQGYEVHHDPQLCELIWLRRRDEAVAEAKHLSSIGLHKQIVNRLLEPWMWTINVVTATEWDNFFKLRDHPAAEPHMQLLAKAMKQARNEAKVVTVRPGEFGWHLPFITMADFNEQAKVVKTVQEQFHNLKVLSVARCVSTSYKIVNGFDITFEKAREIYTKLSGPPAHASPFEHVAQADEYNSGYKYDHPSEHRNFIGFRQLRAQIEASR